MKKLFSILLLLPTFVWAAIDFEQMISDLELVHWIDHVLEKPLPLNYNYIFSTGYFVTPSARLSPPGMIGFGYGYLNPYQHYNVLVQPFSRLELSVNWRIFKGVKDLGLSQYGFGDFADRGANFKLSLLTPEDSCGTLPALAVGIEDFMGSKNFTNYFVVGTQVWEAIGLELSVGWGFGRYQGFFGGTSWYPYYHKTNPFLCGLGFTAEVDPVNYKDDPHPKVKAPAIPINFGVQYNYNDLLSLSCSSWRGRECAVTAALIYNLGTTKGFLPKINDPPVFCGSYAKNFTSHEICQAFTKQGFVLRNAYLSNDLAILTVKNCFWIRERDMRHRLAHLLHHFPYTDVKRFIVIVESYNLRCQSYCFSRDWIERYCLGTMGLFEFDLLTRRKEPCSVDKEQVTLLYSGNPYKPDWQLEPRFETFFGSAKGKFKYDLGLQANIDGSLPYRIYYELLCSVTVLSTLNDVIDFDRYNPSQLPNVATDYINYRNQGGFSTDRLYIQAVQNLPSAFFVRLGLGYFQVNYAGLAGELLWYPANSCLAIGIEGALLKKRTYNGLNFQSKIRTLDGFTPTYHPYTILDQYFLDFYLDIPECSLFTKLSLGAFLAKDKGGRLEVTRYFQSGLRLTGWISVTNANDTMHSVRYFDRGVAIEMPLELFYRHSCRRVGSYALAAWLRDAGYRSWTGRSLFDILNRERRY